MQACLHEGRCGRAWNYWQQAKMHFQGLNAAFVIVSSALQGASLAAPQTQPRLLKNKVGSSLQRWAAGLPSLTLQGLLGE